MGSLAGRIAVVTGASRGIGKGIAIALGEQG
jgi:NAD(P)-dependent dehydrogenase (short-subunit alcohol dehydrogenase family)